MPGATAAAWIRRRRSRRLTDNPSYTMRMRAPGRFRLALGLVAAAFGAVISAVLLLRHYGLDAGALAAAACDAAGGGCETVAASAWSAIFGVPLAAVGLAFFVCLAFLLALSLVGGVPITGSPPRLALFLVTLALIVDGFLFGVQALAIGAYCPLCLWTYGANAAMFLTLLPARRRPRTPSAEAAASPRRQAPAEVLAVKAFWLTAALVAVAVLVINDGLRVKGEVAETMGDVSILGVRGSAGTPLPPGTPRSVSAAGLPAQWRNPPFRQQPVRDVNLDGVPFRGADDAPVKIVTFSDFLCPSCRRFALAYDQYAEGATGPHVSLYYRAYPLDGTCAQHIPGTPHPGACHVSRGAMCASQLGAFWEYHDQVYRLPPANPSPADVTGIAVQAGLDQEAFRACLDTPETESRLQEDIAEAVRLGVTGTPTIFINGRRLPSLEEFADAVLWELEKAGVETP